MSDHCPDCGAPLVCLRDRLETELADLRGVVDLAVRQVRERYASLDVSAATDWKAAAARPSWAELQRRRHPFTGVAS